MNFDGLHLIVGVGVSLDNEFERFSEEKAHLQDYKTSFLPNVEVIRGQRRAFNFLSGGIFIAKDRVKL